MINNKIPSCNLGWTVTTQPVSEPITLQELKDFAHIDGTDEDILLNSFIESARRAAENYLRRALLEQTITLKMDYWPSEIIELPRPPLISITAIETLDESNTATVYSSDNYYIITGSDPGFVVIKQGITFPINTERSFGGIQVRYKAGYGTNRTDIPNSIRDGIKLWATEIYENRFVRDDPPPEAMNLLSPYRMLRIN
jgi:uncharacterized phiE125 gp8 family phage protein